MRRDRLRSSAILTAVLTTWLWSGSYILNKLAFQGGIGPLTLSGLRYLIAALVLFALNRRVQTPEKHSRLPWRTVAALGLLGYAVAQGLQYVGQSYLTPTQASLLLSVGNTALVMLADRALLRETQTRADWLKLLWLLGGITLYYRPWQSGEFSWPGALFMALSSIGYALQMTLNRKLLAKDQADARALVAGPMLWGAMPLLVAGLLLEPAPVFSWNLMLILAYLSLVSGALGFTLWTRSQAYLTAFESSGINNLMLLEIALLDVLVFRRVFDGWQLAAIALVFGAIVAIQTRRAPKSKIPEPRAR